MMIRFQNWETVVALIAVTLLILPLVGRATDDTIRWGQPENGLQLGIDCPSVLNPADASYSLTNIHCFVRNVTTNAIEIPVMYGPFKMCIVVEGSWWPCFYSQHSSYINRQERDLWHQVRNLPPGTAECVLSCSYRDLSEPDGAVWIWAWKGHPRTPRNPFAGSTNRTMRFVLASQSLFVDEPLRAQSEAVSVQVVTNTLNLDGIRR